MALRSVSMFVIRDIPFQIRTQEDQETISTVNLLELTPEGLMEYATNAKEAARLMLAAMTSQKAAENMNLKLQVVSLEQEQNRVNQEITQFESRMEVTPECTNGDLPNRITDLQGQLAARAPTTDTELRQDLEHTQEQLRVQ